MANIAEEQIVYITTVDNEVDRVHQEQASADARKEELIVEGKENVAVVEDTLWVPIPFEEQVE